MNYDNDALAHGAADQDEPLLPGRMLRIGIVIDSGSANAVLASSKETPCFRTFADALRGSHKKRSPIGKIYAVTGELACMRLLMMRPEAA